MTCPLPPGTWGIFGGWLIVAWGDLQGHELWQLILGDRWAVCGGVL